MNRIARRWLFLTLLLGSMADADEPAAAVEASPSTRLARTGQDSLAAAIATSAPGSYAETWLTWRINNRPVTNEPTRFLRHLNGRLFAPPASFGHWRVPMPSDAPIVYQGEHYLPVDGVQDLMYLVDEGSRELRIYAHPETFLSKPTGSDTLALLNARGVAEPETQRDSALLPYAARRDAVSGIVPESDSYTEFWLAARINGVPDQDTTLVVRHANGRLYAQPEAFQRWRMHAPPSGGMSLNGAQYLPLDGVEGLTYLVDEGNQALVIRGRPESFVPSLIDGRGTASSPPAARTTGGFVNYDLQYLNQDDQHEVSGLFELGLFNPLGVATSTFLGREFGDGADLIRLDSTWTYDRPEQLQTARLGDSINRSGAWGRAVRFGGLQWGTNYATQPYFVPFPLPAITGEAVLPSTVEVFSDNAQRLSDDVPPGPFVIPNLPVANGAGEVTLVVRDLLGRERVITQPYYVSQALLRKGLRDYSYELGFVREDFGLRSNDYGRFFAAGTHRAGITDRATGELRAELLENQQTAGVGGSFLWPTLGTANAALAASRRDADAGGLISFGFDRLSRRLSYGLQSEFTTHDFAQLGLQPGEPAPRQTTTARIGFPVSARDSLSLSYLQQDNRNQEDAEFLTLGYGIDLGRDFYLTAFALKDLTGGSGDSIGMLLTHPLGERTTATASWFNQDNGSAAELQLQRNLPPGRGAGYRLIAGIGDNARDMASVFAQNDVGSYSAEAARFQGANALRLNAAGGLAVVDGRGYLSRWLDDSFGVVKVADYPDVQIYAENQPIARTGPDGTALVPRLRAFQRNRLSIEQADLPLDAQIDGVEMDAVPAFRSGVLVDFPVHPVRGALLTIVLEDGSPVPLGAVVNRVGDALAFPVAMRGEVYVTGLEADNRLQVKWHDGACLLEVEWPATGDPLPRIGPLICADSKLAERAIELDISRRRSARACRLCENLEDTCRGPRCYCACSTELPVQRTSAAINGLPNAVAQP